MSAWTMKREAGGVLALVGALVAVGCAAPSAESEPLTSAPRQEVAPLESQEARQDARAPEPFEPKSFVARYATPAQCEAGARHLRSESADEGWEALRACVEHMPFTLLQALLSEAWAEDLGRRPDAAQLIARVVAMRGGSVEGDLELLHARRVPIFGLSAAVAQPDTYKGRYVLLRAQVVDMSSDGGKPTVVLAEQSLSSVETDREVGEARQTDKSSSMSGALGGRASLLGSGRLSGRLRTDERKRDTKTVKHYDNVSMETGREALGRLPKPEPFLTPGKDFVVLARFDGVRVTSAGAEDEDSAPKVPVLTIVGYYRPHPLVVY